MKIFHLSVKCMTCQAKTKIRHFPSREWHQKVLTFVGLLCEWSGDILEFTDRWDPAFDPACPFPGMGFRWKPSLVSSRALSICCLVLVFLTFCSAESRSASLLAFRRCPLFRAFRSFCVGVDGITWFLKSGSLLARRPGPSTGDPPLLSSLES